MKKSIILLSSLLLLSLVLNAQIKVESDGSVGIGTTLPEKALHVKEYDNSVQLRLERTGSSTGKCDIGSASDNLYVYPGGYVSGGCVLYVGDDGKVGINTTSPSYTLHVNGGGLMATYSTNTSKFYVNNTSYLILGSNTDDILFYYSAGTGYNEVSADEFHNVSDVRFKDNIQDIKSGLETILLLNGKEYDKIISTDSSDNKSYQHNYGLIAQEVEQVLPELVTEKMNIKMLNYNGFIPFLIEAIKEQQALIENQNIEITNLDKRISALEKPSNLKSNKLKNNTIDIYDEQATTNRLFQNSPNPFSQNTEIKFFINNTAQKANMYIYNLQGIQISSYPISDRGNSSIIINSSELQAGTYLYTLIVDGKEVDSKKMLLTKN